AEETVKIRATTRTRNFGFDDSVEGCTIRAKSRPPLFAGWRFRRLRRPNSGLPQPRVNDRQVCGDELITLVILVLVDLLQSVTLGVKDGQRVLGKRVDGSSRNVVVGERLGVGRTHLLHVDSVQRNL